MKKNWMFYDDYVDYRLGQSRKTRTMGELLIVALIFGIAVLVMLFFWLLMEFWVI
jgi:hypothetical protein